MMKGIVTLEFVNKDTGEKRTLQRENVIVNSFYTADYGLTYINSYPSILGNKNSVGTYIHLTSYSGATNRNFSTLSQIPTSLVSSGNASRTYNDVALPFIEFYWQYPNPGTDRSFQTVALCNDPTISIPNVQVTAYTVFPEVCVQGANEFLNLYYRIQCAPTANRDTGLIAGRTQEHATAFFASVWNGGGGSSPSVLQAQGGGFGITGNRFENSPLPSFYNYPQMDVTYGIFNSGSQELSHIGGGSFFSSVARNAALFAVTKYYSVPTWAAVGLVIKGYSTGVDIRSASPFSSTPFNFQSPGNIHGIFKHAATATGPFFDALTNGSSAGAVDIDGTWNKLCPELYFLDVITTGALGVGTYKLRRRRVTGFAGNTYEAQPMFLPYLNAIRSSFPNAHGLSPRSNNFVVYDEHRIVFWDDTGVTLLNVFDGTHQTWDADSTPALNVADIQQCSTDRLQSDILAENAGASVIYVACAVSGLYEIIPGINDVNQLSTTACYAVDVGFDFQPVAVFEGRVCVGPDYTTPAGFDYTPITTTWSTVSYIKVDPASAAYQTAIVRNNGDVIWWSTAASQAVFALNVPNAQTAVHGRVDVSDFGGQWYSLGNSTSQLRKLTFGSASSILLSSGAEYQYLNCRSITFCGSQLVGYSTSPGRTGLLTSLVQRAQGVSSGPGSGSLPVSNQYKYSWFLYEGSTSTLTPNLNMEDTGNNQEPFAYLGYGIFYWCYSMGGTAGTTPSNFTLPIYSATIVHSPSSLFEESFGWDGSDWSTGSSSAKTFHSTTENLIDGLTINFQEGTEGFLFVATNYLTFGCTQGMLKDNATSLSFNTTFYFKRVFKSVAFAGASVSGGVYAPTIVTDPDFISLLNDNVKNFSISLAGTPALVRFSGPPNAGEVQVNSNGFVFNVADNGKAITGTYSYLLH